MDFKELNDKVVEWALEKGIFDKATPFSQHGKTLEEVDELTEAIEAQEGGHETFTNKDGRFCNTKFEIIDAIGDILVTLIIQSKMQDITPEECLEKAYSIISKRTGKMVDGVFVKDE